MRYVEDKVAFITGGASGIGFAMALTFLRAGMKVVIADMSRANLDDAARRLAGEEGKFHLIGLDVTSRPDMAKAADEAEAVFGKIHLLCNNAGVALFDPMISGSFEIWDRSFKVNVEGVINGIVTIVPRIQAHGEGGHVVNTSSLSGILPLPGDGGIYTATKFAVRGISEGLRLALAPDRIGVSALFPGLTRTRILEGIGEAAKAKGGEVDAVSAEVAAAERCAMDPMILAQAVLDSVRRNDAYILPHSEVIDEVKEQCAELVGAFRTDIPVDPDRAAIEDGRRQMTKAINASMSAW